MKNKLLEGLLYWLPLLSEEDKDELLKADRPKERKS